MIRTINLSLMVLNAIALLGFGPLHAGDKPPRIEVWADRSLPVTKGLLLWLDASRQSDARKAAGLPPLKDGDPISIWRDGSGRNHDVVQKDSKAQPLYHPTGEFHAFRFNGQSSHLRLPTQKSALQEMTVFVVAAPYSAPEWFSGILSMSAKGRNDFETGLNIDQGVGNPSRLEVINIEGAGSAGMKNLLKEPVPHGNVVRLCITSAPEKDGITLWMNAKRQGTRDRAVKSMIHMDELILGGRFYTLGGPPEVRGFFDGDIAEVLVYDHVLSDKDRTAVEKYLAAKYEKIAPLPLPTTGKSLTRVKDPPPVQLLVPGFSVHKLPVELPNVNNVLYRSDGKLVALGYDGNVWLLSDTDGDGLEDKASLFWDNQGRIRGPIGMALTPPGYKLGNGVFVASKGKVSLLVDGDKDDKADKEIIVAEGWKELPHGVDALGVAVDKDGSVYFGLGTTNFTDAYLIGKDGKARYDLKNERGTILRVEPDFKKRHIVATGIRFPVGLRFNKYGDLFATDQEGATWLPNGNPFDELLHIETGRHYGFPPRHPRHLPGVIDEPSVFDYEPQHQSTCGLNFNEPVNSGPVFGPAWWESDVFVTGYSRGKLYRTKLIKTSAGYVAQNQLLASLNLLTCDVCVSPWGELIVACHSGGPDWGSGPTGKGTLYKIRYSDRDAPQPVLAWAQSPREVRIAFDRPLLPKHLLGVTKASIEFGRYAAAGDRFESLWPGYKVVQDQMRSPRFSLGVHSVQLLPDGRTLMLSTAEHPETAGYALTLPGLGRLETTTKSAEQRQLPETDLRYDLCGVEATWRSMKGDTAWTGWLPHFDLDVAESLTNQSADHRQLWKSSHASGLLTLRTRLDLTNMLRPVVQPGSRIDHDWPTEKVTLTFKSSTSFKLTIAGKEHVADRKEKWFVSQVELDALERVLLEVQLQSEARKPDLSVTWHTNEDARSRALPLKRFLLLWAPAERIESPTIAAEDMPELKGGNWSRGKKVFFSDLANCFKCHAVRGEGGKIGPDLSNLPHRDYHSVLRDITEPSYAINPDYITQMITLHDGRVFTGTVRSEGDRLHIGDIRGEVMSFPRDGIESLQPTRASAMPEGLPKVLGPERMRDLLTFLLTDPPHMPEYGKSKLPEPRSRKEVAALLAGAPSPLGPMRKLKVVLVAGPKDHGPGEHDYPAWQKMWGRLMRMMEDVVIESADVWPTPNQLKTADVLVIYQQGKWTPERARDMDAFLARGGGAVYIHYAVDGGTDAPGFAQRIGLAWQGGRSRFRHGMLELGFTTGPMHPVSRNLDKLRLYDESYWKLVGDPKRITLLASGKEEGTDQPLFWTIEPGKGRVFVSIPGHFAWTFDDPVYRALLLRGIAWAAREPVDRFNELVLPGARVKD